MTLNRSTIFRFAALSRQGAFLLGLAACAAVALGFLRVSPAPAAELLALLAAGIAWLLGVDKANEAARGTSILLFLGCAWALLGVASESSFAGIKDAVQPALGLVVAASAVRNLAHLQRRALMPVIALGWVASGVYVLGQQLSGVPALAAGAGFDSRALYGVCLALLAPAALNGLGADKQGPVRRIGATALCVLLGLTTITYLPALVILAITVIGWSAWRGTLPALAAALALGALFTGALLASPDPVSQHRREQLRSSVALRDAHGLPRRWTVESRAALRAAATRPVFGHGPASYQDVVGDPQYRTNLPMTAENQVEPDSQIGYLVLAVQYGLPAVLCIAAGLAAAAWSGLRRSLRSDGAPGSSAAGWSAVGTLLALAVAMPVAQGAEVLLGAMLGLALGGEGERRGWMQRTGLPRLSVQTALLGATAAAALLAGRTLGLANGADGSSNEPANLRAAAFQVEAEDAADMGDLFRAREMEGAEGRRGVTLDEVPKHRLAADPGAAYDLFIPRADTYRIWVRAWWPDGCSNSVAIQVNDKDPVLAGNDGTYLKWHWIRGPELSLEAGRHTLRLLPREPNVRIDRILVGRKTDGLPPQTTEGKTENNRSRPDTAPLWAPPERERKTPFLAAVGGTYQNGPEAILFEMGIPYERLRMDELADSEALDRYDLVWISGVQWHQSGVWSAMEEYVRNGGAAVAEIVPDIRKRSPWHEQAQKLAPFAVNKRKGLPRHWAKQNTVVLHADGSPWFANMPEQTELYDEILLRFLGPVPDNEGTSHGRIVMDEREIGPVGVTRAHDKGQFVYLSVPLGFTSMWRGTRLDPVAKEMLRKALDGRFDPLFHSLSTIGRPSRGRIFADDFMRERGTPDNWRVLDGTFLLAGGPKEAAQAKKSDAPAHIPFTLHGSGQGVAEVPLAQAGESRLSASVLAEDGAGGIGIKTSTGQELSLIYDAPEEKLQLVQGTGRSIRILDETAVHRTPPGWRRLSLMREKNDWTGWFDGRRLLRAPAKQNEESNGSHIRLVQTGGSVHYDDVSLVERAALIPDTDRTWGEEGSSWSHPRQTEGVEPRTIYSPLWHLRPDAYQRNAVRSSLPCHGEDTLVTMDGATLGRIPAGPGRPLILLPENEQPRQSLRLTSALWRDYSFQGQLIDWYSTGAQWRRIPRWACDRQWEWLGVPSTEEPAALWYRHRLEPPYSISFLCAPTANDEENRRGYGEKGEDLNLIVGGNGHDLEDGIVLRTGRVGRTGISLQRGNETLAQTRSIGLPRSLGTTLHHRWLWIQADVEKDRIVIRYEGRTVLDVPLETPVDTGFAGFWTVHNSVQIARATLSLSQSPDFTSPAASPPPPPPERPASGDSIEQRNPAP